ncbi:hypothetical protein [Methanolapillus millepedarum]|uniref:hypothetical protein n=1 Tax=Methanolapillus millepedarum TaxID=3028296 RepID=UPI0030B8CC90
MSRLRCRAAGIPESVLIEVLVVVVFLLWFVFFLKWVPDLPLGGVEPPFMLFEKQKAAR